MKQICEITKKEFIISDAELAHIEKLNFQNPYFKEPIPLPKIHPFEDLRRIFTFINYIHIYKRQSALSGKSQLSRYPQELVPKVCSAEEFFSDRVDNSAFGRAVDFNRSFLEQWHELMRECDFLALSNVNPENSDYVNGTINVRNCYLCFCLIDSQDCLYVFQSHNCNDCVSCLGCAGCDFCYNCLDCENCYECQESKECRNSNNCFASDDLIGCHYCIGCIGLRNCQYYLFNEEVGKEKYEQFISQYRLTDYQSREELIKNCEKAIKEKNHQINTIINCVNSSGSNLRNCKNVFNSYFTNDSEDCGFLVISFAAKDAWRGMAINSELVYRSLAVRSYNDLFNLSTVDSSSCAYSTMCYNGCANCFGCVGLKKKSYYILNKEYSKQEYFDLLPRVVQLMKKYGEWGEFFPLKYSPYYYDGSCTPLYFKDLSESEFLKRGYKFSKNEAVLDTINISYLKDALLSDLVELEVNNIINKEFKCEATNHLFRFTKKEVEFYKRNNIALPRTYWKERLFALLRKRTLIPDA